MLIDLTFKGEKATYEFANGLGKLGLALAVALKDGFQPLKDLVVIAKSAIADLVPVLHDISQLDDDFKENKLAFMHSWQKVGEDVFEELVALKKEKLV